MSKASQMPVLVETELDGGSVHSDVLAQTQANTEAQAALEQVGGENTVAIPSQSSPGLAVAITDLVQNVEQGNADAQYDGDVGQSGGKKRRSKRKSVRKTARKSRKVARKSSKKTRKVARKSRKVARKSRK